MLALVILMAVAQIVIFIVGYSSMALGNGTAAGTVCGVLLLGCVVVGIICLVSAIKGLRNPLRSKGKSIATIAIGADVILSGIVLAMMCFAGSAIIDTANENGNNFHYFFNAINLLK